jgi:2-keto-4-pentenoate hydratase
MQQKQPAANGAGLLGVARSFVEARQGGKTVITYPGKAPSSLQEAYAIQDEAISLWTDTVAGWKVGRITGEDEKRFGVDRLVGPIFKNSIRRSNAKAEPMPVFESGFAAVEGEIVIILGVDAPPNKMQWATDEASALIQSIAAGIEIASSPFPGINDSGPLVTISDFGNNFGLIIGNEIPDWKSFEFDKWRCETFIDGKSVGKESPASIPGGPIESLRFLLELSAKRGLPLKKGMSISTGAITGVHAAQVGQSASVVFDGVDPIRCELLNYTPPDPQSATLRQSA